MRSGARSLSYATSRGFAGGLGALSASAPPAPYAWPVPGGYATSPFGMRKHPITGARKFHNGLDIGKGTGAEIVAPTDGRISFRSDDVNKDAGRYVVLEHDDGWKSSYLHLLTSPLSVGARVRRGQVIGLMGSTGASTAPHLHWIVRNADGSVVDPLVTLRGGFPQKGGGSISGQFPGVPWAKIALAGAAAYWFFTKRR